MNRTVAILLSTYNSGKYLMEQLESINNQTYSNWHLFVRDDGSNDNTLQILSDFHSLQKDKMTLITDNKGNVGPCRSFECIMLQCPVNYMMFCDHDDIWLPNKIELTISVMIEKEKQYPNFPILICTDLIVVDANLNVINQSMWNYMKNKPIDTNNIYELAVNNFVTGCTILINKRAKDISLPFVKETIMHDWWIALKVCKNGIITAIPQSTILYRQHESNALGSHNVNRNYFISKFSSIRYLIQGNKELFNMFKVIKPDFNILILFYIKMKVILYKLTHNYK